MFTIFERRSIATAHKLRINSRACKEYVLILAHIGSTILSDELCFADDLYVPWYVKKWTTIFLVIKMRTALEKLFDLFVFLLTTFCISYLFIARNKGKS